MLVIEPFSVNVTGIAFRDSPVDTELYIPVLPMVEPAGGADSWVTATVLFETPEPAIVTVAVLGLAPVFSEYAVTVTVPLFVPDAGDTLNQLASPVTLQVVLDVMLNEPLANEL